ncbi:MAG: hypothetical protein J4N29_05070 [Chloroflexi bacterium]|nr:hypothetical protein [Chloroflexota bacterium]MCI0816401.1 hypothetical protein [Chloroflexota bacterium]
MATITLRIPDPLIPGLAASVRSVYGDAVAALSDADACKHAAKAHLRQLYRAGHKRTASSAAVSAADAALAAKEAAAAAAVQARKDAEDAALSRADADFDGVA